jgi:DNA-binding NarL/FixJ family response regulator
MYDVPIRVAVISRNHVVRAGLVSLVAQLHGRAVVTDAASVDTDLGGHDIAIYDLGAGHDSSTYVDLQRLLDTGTQVIGLVYDTQRDTVPDVTGATRHVITLSVTPEQLLEVLERTTARREQRQGDSASLGLPGGLTEREFRVVALIGEGLSNAQIAKELYISDNTVKTYIRTGYRKLGLANRQSAMLWALEHGLSGGQVER